MSCNRIWLQYHQHAAKSTKPSTGALAVAQASGEREVCSGGSRSAASPLTQSTPCGPNMQLYGGSGTRGGQRQSMRGGARQVCGLCRASDACASGGWASIQRCVSRVHLTSTRAWRVRFKCNRSLRTRWEKNKDLYFSLYGHTPPRYMQGGIPPPPSQPASGMPLPTYGLEAENTSFPVFLRTTKTRAEPAKASPCRIHTNSKHRPWHAPLPRSETQVPTSRFERLLPRETQVPTSQFERFLPCTPGRQGFAYISFRAFAAPPSDKASPAHAHCCVAPLNPMDGVPVGVRNESGCE